MAAALDQQGILQIVSMVVQLLIGLHNQGTISGQTDLVSQLKDAHQTLQDHLASGAPLADSPQPAAVDKVHEAVTQLTQSFDALRAQLAGKGA